MAWGLVPLAQVRTAYSAGTPTKSDLSGGASAADIRAILHDPNVDPWDFAMAVYKSQGEQALAQLQNSGYLAQRFPDWWAQGAKAPYGDEALGKFVAARESETAHRDDIFGIHGVTPQSVLAAGALGLGIGYGLEVLGGAGAGAAAEGVAAASTSAAVTIPAEAGFEANVFAGAPIAAEGAGAAGLVSTLQTANTIAGTYATVARVLTPPATHPAAQPYQPGSTTYYFGAPGTPAGYPSANDLGLMDGAGAFGGTFGQVAIGLVAAFVLVYLTTHWRKLHA